MLQSPLKYNGSPPPTSTTIPLVDRSKPRLPRRLLYRRDFTPDELCRLVKQIGRRRLLTAINCVDQAQHKGKPSNGRSLFDGEKP